MKISLKLLQLVITVLLLVRSQANGSETKQCPSYCTCDLVENLNRADCSGQRLITPNVEVPTAVELLDLSYNDITTLDNACFDGLIYVVNLTISHNALHTIYLDAFSPLKEAKSIDLSFNRLEYFDERIFETNTKLTRLNLSGNKFMSLQNKPILKSTTVQYLELHDAQVSYIYPLMFQEMPALREVDVSKNLMITLSGTAFNSLRQLETLNLEQNRWICDRSLELTLQSLKKRGVETKLSSCSFTDLKRGRGSAASPMFERMMEAPPTQIVATESASVENVWKPKKPPFDYELDKGILCEELRPGQICELYINCLAHMRVAPKEKVDSKVLPRGVYTINDLHFVFLTGVSLGIALVTCIVTFGICVRRCFTTKQKISQRRTEGTRVVNISTTHRPIPPPVPLRQHRTNRRSVNPPPLNRSLSSPARRGTSSNDGNQSDFATFVSRFFERPSRHQYYRTINENTAHMIRRLSQSNLFNNRLSQHFTGPRSSNSENIQQTEPLIYPQAIEGRSTSDHIQVHLSPDERWQGVGSVPFRRPETPPPSYGDVVKP